MRWLAVLVLVACTSTPAPVPPAAPPTLLAKLEASADLDGQLVGPSDAPATIAVVFASWCSHCKTELAILDGLRVSHPGVRVLGINVRAQEEYADRGSTEAVRAYVLASAPWLRVVPADDALFTALGRPPKVPTLYVFDRRGALVETFDRRTRAMPTADELDRLLRQLGA